MDIDKISVGSIDNELSEFYKYVNGKFNIRQIKKYHERKDEI